MNTHGWKADVLPDWTTASHDRLFLYRDRGAKIEMVTTIHDQTIIKLFDHGEHTGDFNGLHLPTGAAMAIAEALKPGPSTGELKRLEEALELERRRVDRMLDSMI